MFLPANKVRTTISCLCALSNKSVQMQLFAKCLLWYAIMIF